jgi:hypothetical protein
VHGVAMLPILPTSGVLASLSGVMRKRPNEQSATYRASGNEISICPSWEVALRQQMVPPSVNEELYSFSKSTGQFVVTAKSEKFPHMKRRALTINRV